MYIGKKALVVMGLIVAVALGSFALYVGMHGFSARDKPLAIEAFFARQARLLSIPAGGKNRKNPLPAGELAIAEGRDHFADHCAVCHANNGSGKTEMGSNLYPPAPDMRNKDTQGLTDGQLLYIIRNGVRFTGMPGWGGGDDDNWKLVLFIRHLPQLSADETDLMKEVNQMGPEETSGEMKH